MGRFTRIAETNLPGTLGGIVGQAAGTVIGNANISLEKLKEKITTISQKIDNNAENISAEIEQVEQTLDSLEKTILKVEQSAENLNTTITSIRVPIVALKIAVNIAKYLPLPSPIASVSVLQADIVQMVSELIAQIEQIILTLESIIKVILDLLKKLKDLISELRKILSVLKTKFSFQTKLSETDKNILKDTGIFGVVEQLPEQVTSQISGIIWVGNYSEIETGSLIVQNQVKAAESGTTIDIVSGIPGFWNTYAYCVSETQPRKPVSTDFYPKGWKSGDKITGEQNIWQIKGIVSGLVGKVVQWSSPVSCRKPDVKILPKVPWVSRKVNVFRYTYSKFQKTNFNLQEANAIILTGSDEGYSLFLEILQALDNLPIDPGLKSELQVEINPQPDQVPENEVDYYTSKAGETYTLRLKTSSISPKIATQRYVEVIDNSGTVVYEGSRTFATNPQVLFEETKVRLIQLLG